MRSRPKRCWQCGTYGIFTPLVSLFERMRCFNIPPSYFECEDERECYRRQRMNMGPTLPWPGPTF